MRGYKHMDQQNLAGESAGNTAASNESAKVTEQAAKIAELQARLDRETKDKEVYRSGLLAAKDLGRAAKRITVDDMSDPELLEKAIDAKIEHTELERKAAEETRQKAESDEAVRKENEELRRTLEALQAAGSGGSQGMGSGHNESSESRPSTYWTDAQRSELRQIYTSRGIYNAGQIDSMVKKAEEIAIAKTAQSSRANDIVKTRPY